MAPTLTVLQIAVISLMASAVWFNFLLPWIYYIAAVAIGLLFAISIMKKAPSRYIFLQLSAIFLLINNIYGLSTQFNVLPHGDSYWEYQVLRIFEQSGRVYTIPGTASTVLLTWYSGWPAIHVIALALSGVAGFSLFQTMLILPQILSIVFFLIVYALLKTLADKLQLSSLVVYLGLLIFALSPDVLFWRTIFVRMNLGLVLITLLFYLVFLWVVDENHRNRRTQFLFMLTALVLIATHHFTSFFASTILLSLSIIQIARKRISLNSRLKLPSPFPQYPSIALILLTFFLTFIWWNDFGGIIWPTVSWGINRFIQVLTGSGEFSFYVPIAIYPVQLTQLWAMTLVRLRDIIMYVPAILGFVVFWFRKGSSPTKSFLLYLLLSFVVIFAVNGVTFKVEPFRLVAMVLPFLAVLTAAMFDEARVRLKRLWTVVLPALLVLLMLSSFVGLWGHNFAPVHLYDPAISSVDVGEHQQPLAIGDYIKRIPLEDTQIFTDDFGVLSLYLNSSQLNLIRRINIGENITIGDGSQKVIFFELLGSNMYEYYASIYSYVSDPVEAQRVAREIRQQLSENFNVLFDDGQHRIWESE